MEDLRLAEDSAAGVGAVAQPAPDDGPVPAVLASAGRDALAGEPSGQVRDRGAVVGVAAEQLGHQRRLMLDHLVAGAAFGGLADVVVAERGAAQHVDRTGLGAVGLAAPVPFGQLGLLILGEHALELHQQLVLGAVTAGALDELHPGPGPAELLDQDRKSTRLNSSHLGISYA